MIATLLCSNWGSAGDYLDRAFFLCLCSGNLWEAQFEDFELPFRGLFFQWDTIFPSPWLDPTFDRYIEQQRNLSVLAPLTARARHSIVIGDGDDRGRELQKVTPHRVAGPLPRPRPWVEIVPVEVVVTVTPEDWLDSFPATSMAVTVYV